MTEHRWSKFWWQDYANDNALRSCTLAAQGLWMRMLCAMHDGEPYGHLLINGRSPSTRQIANIASAPEREVERLLEELSQAGIFSRDAAGVIFSRRMVRDKEVSDRGRANGKDGGNPALKKPHKVSGNGGSNDGGLTPPVKLQDTEAETERKLPASPGVSAIADPPFDARAEVWSAGLARLMALTGLPVAKAKSRLGQLLRDAGDDCPRISAILRDCPATGDPQAWLSAAAKSRGRSMQPTSKLAWMLEPRPPSFDLELEPERVMQ